MQEAVRNVRNELCKLEDDRWKLPKQAVNLFPMGYDVETDVSPELGPKLASCYQSWIGVLRWIVELGHVDVITEASLLASQLALPKEFHLEALLHLFAHLGDKHNARLVLDPTYPKIDQKAFIDLNIY